MTLKKFSFSKLFSNTRFRVFFALFAAFFFWLSITIDLNDVITDTYEISIENINAPSWLGGQNFQVVSRSADKVKVTVTGPVSIVSSLDDDDIEIAGNFNEVDAESASYEIPLLVSNAEEFPGVTFKIEPQTVWMEIDMFTEKEFVVEAIAPNVTLDEKQKETMHIASPVFMDAKFENIKISGPNSKLELIHSVKAVVDKKGEISKTTSYTGEIKLYDKDGNEITDTSPYTFSKDKIGIVVLVQPKKTVKLVASFVNTEENISINGVLSVENVTVYGPSDIIDSLTEIELEPIDVKQVSPNNKVFVVKPVLPQGVRIDEVVHGNEEFTVTVTVSKNAAVPFLLQ